MIESKPTSPFADSFGRQISYLRVSITDRCNFRCVYCMPEDGINFVPRPEILTYEEITEIVSVFAEHGVRRVRLTGGEPLVRADVVDLVASLKSIPGIEELCLTTNAFLLPKLAEPLKAAGLDQLNISLDSLRAERFEEITRVGDLERVIAGIDAAIAAGFESIKVNAVVVRGFNDDELLDLIRFAAGRGLIMRFIEFMPIGGDTVWGDNACVTAQEMRQAVSEAWTVSLDPPTGKVAGPSRYWSVSGDGLPAGTKFGIISAVTECFCADCNRVRVTPKGGLRACLADDREINLRDLLRSPASPEDRRVRLATAIESALFGKKEKHAFDLDGGAVTGKRMHAIGG